MARRRYEDEFEEEDDFDDDDRRRDRRGQKKQSNSALLWVGLAAGGVILLGVCLVSIVFGVILRQPGNERADKQPGAAKPFDPAAAAAKAEPIAFPELGLARLIQPGVQFQEATLRRGAMPMKVWYYRPERAKGKLPLVLVPPAGSTLCAGMDLGEGDRPEHYPYARAGFAVASFEIDGHVPNLPNVPDAVVFKGAREFRDANAGLANAKAALDFILAKAPDVDPSQIFVAGHSSAATLALLVAAHEPRVKACVAYAPCTDVEARVAQIIPLLERELPGYRDFLRFSSPKTHADKLKCPVFLFHAQDDANLPISQTRSFAAQLSKTNSKVTVVESARGGHYDSMIAEGIPKGIAWLKQLPK